MPRLRKILASEGLERAASDLPSVSLVKSQLKSALTGKRVGKFYDTFVVDVQVISDYAVDVVIGFRWRNSDRVVDSSTAIFDLVSPIKKLFLDFVASHDWAEGLGTQTSRDGVYVSTHRDSRAPISQPEYAVLRARIFTPVVMSRTFPHLLR